MLKSCQALLYPGTQLLFDSDFTPRPTSFVKHTTRGRGNIVLAIAFVFLSTAFLDITGKNRGHILYFIRSHILLLAAKLA